MINSVDSATLSIICLLIFKRVVFFSIFSKGWWVVLVTRRPDYYFPVFFFFSLFWKLQVLPERKCQFLTFANRHIICCLENSDSEF